jgi:hypothetical protein
LDSYQLNTLWKIYEAVKKTKLRTCHQSSSDFLHLVQGPPGSSLPPSSVLIISPPRPYSFLPLFPGCGKTHFLVHLLDLFVNHFDLNLSSQSPHPSPFPSSPCTILVCAPSNKAISVVVEKYLEILSPNRWQDRPIVIVGVQEKLESCSSHRHHTHSAAAEGSGQDSNSNKQTLLQISTEICEILSLTSSPQTQPSGLLPPSLVHLITAMVSPVTSTDCLIYNYPPRCASLFLGFSIVYSECFHQVSHHNSVCRSLVLAILDSLTQEYYHIIETLHHSTPSFASRYCTQLHQSIVRVLEKLSRDLDEENASSTPGDEETERDSTSRVELIKRLTELSEQFVNSSQEYLRDLLDHAAVICSTLSSAGNSLMKSCHNPNKSIDLLLIDEAGQCLESELLIPFYANPLHLVLVGDPKQLPATVLSYQAQKLRLGESSLSRLMDHCGAPYEMLTIQYRMHPEICLFPNQHFYDGQLKTATQVMERRTLSQHLQLSFRQTSERQEEGDWLGNYLWIDVSGSETTGGAYGKSKANPTEATVVARSNLHLTIAFLPLTSPRLVSYFARLTSAPLADHLGVITFYSAQVQQIKKSLHQHLHHSVSSSSSSPQIHVMSVDGFQGSEKDIIIVSFVRCNQHSEVGFVDDFQRLNVSLTRAKYLLVLVGCLETLEESNSLELQKLVKDVRRRERVCSYDTFDRHCR